LKISDCGYKIPPNIKSSGNELSVKFVSDVSVQKAGFSTTILLDRDECFLILGRGSANSYV